MKKIPVVKQRDIKDCGPCCLSSILKYYNGFVPLEIIHNDCYTNVNGTTAYHLISALNKYGFDSYGLKTDKITKDLLMPAVLHLQLKNGLNHFVVVYKVTKNYIVIMDPAKGVVKMPLNEFYEIFSGIVVVCYPKGNEIIKREETSIFKNIYQMLKENKKLFGNILLTGFIIIFFTVLNSMYFKISFNNFDSKDNLKLIAVLFAFLYLSKLIFEFINSYYKNYLIKNINYKLNTEFLSKFFNLPSRVVKNRSSGEIITRVIELNNLHEMVSEVIISTIMNLFLAITSFIVLYFISKLLLMVLIIFIFLFLISAIITNKLVYRMIKENIECNEKFNGVVSEYCNAFESIKNNNIEQFAFFKNKSSIISYLTSMYKINKTINKINFVKNLILDFMHYTLITYGFYLLYLNKISLVNFVTFEAVFVYLIDPIKSFINLIPKYNYLKASMEKILEFMDNKEENLKCLETFTNGDIVIKDLTFSYDNYQNNIKNLCIKIHNCSHVMIKGKSGSGKSTFCKLLNRTYEPSKGMIKINDINILDYSLQTVRSNILYLSQNEFIFDDTIKNNIILNNDFEINKFNKICKICHLDEVINNKPLRYETFINKNFANLSGGEKQRILLARALYKKFEILILDEALSEVNSDLEIDIINNLKSFLLNKTLIYVTHKNHEKYFDKVLKIGEDYE